LLKKINLKKIVIEIGAYNIESALIAQRYGADRVELCSGFAEGGLTPGPGMIKLARKLLSIELYIMIRPREGDFLYTDHEFETMIEDVIFAKNAGADGIVTGLLLANGNVDEKRTRMLVEIAHPMRVTFHRAYDMTNNPYKALETIISTGTTRILTSGQKPDAIQGAGLIVKINEQAAGRIKIMAGCGIKDYNVSEIIKNSGVKEVHLSAKGYTNSKMTFRQPDLFMGTPESDEYMNLLTDGEMIARIVEILKN